MKEWDEHAIYLGNPGLMDTPTLIEWIERELETPEETEARHAEEKRVWAEANREFITDRPFTTGTVTANEIRASRITYDGELPWIIKVGPKFRGDVNTTVPAIMKALESGSTMYVPIGIEIEKRYET